MKQLLTALLIVLVLGCNGQPPPEINPNKVKGNGSFMLYPQTNERLWTIVKLPIIRLKPHDGLGEALDTARKIGYWQSIMLHHNYYGECTIRMYDGTWIVSENPQLALEEMYQIIKSYERMIERLRKSLKPRPSPLPDTAKPIKDKIKMQPRWRMLDGGLFILDSFFNDDAKNYWYYWNQAGSEDTVECVFIVSNTNDVNGICQYFDKNGYVVGGDYPGAVTYLDERKKPMPKNIIVWLSKEIREH